jgi:hypothetical protein
MPMSKGFRSRKRVGALGGFDGFRQKQGVHMNLPRFGPPEGKDLHPACLILYCLYMLELLQWRADAIWRRWKEMAWLDYARLCCRLCKI